MTWFAVRVLRFARRGARFTVFGSRLFVPALVLVVCAGCASEQALPAATPSPTIAVPARPSPPPAAASTQAPAATRPATMRPAATGEPTPTPPAIAQSTASLATPEPFVYLWPAYVPADMRVSPGESRVAHEGEIGQNGLGFFIVTFTSGSGKLVVGGGATDTLPLAGDQRRIVVGGRAATLTTSGAGRQVAFDVPKGSLFVYSSNLSEEELLRVAGSLQPIDLTDMRKRLGAE
jgi:hypothetical protein